MSTANLDLVINLQDKASRGLDTISRNVGDVGEKSSMLSNALSFAAGGAIVSGIGKIASGIGGLVGEMIGGNAQFETYNAQFETMLGSADDAKKRLSDLAQFGASTPFELPEIVEADKILQGFGLHSEKSAKQFGFSGEQIRTIAGDVASGTGTAFNEMTLLLGKFSTGATGEAISRMAELGITSRAELAEMGLEFSKSGELLSPLPQSMETVLNLMQDKYGGLMDAQSTTFSGMMSNLSDWKSNTLRTLGAPIFEVVQQQLGNLLGFLNNPATMDALNAFATTLAGGIGSAMTFLTDTAIPGMIGAWQTVRPAIDLVIGAFSRVREAINMIVEGFQEGGIGQAFATAVNEVQTMGGQFLGWIGGQASAIGTQLLTWGQAFVAWVAPMIQPALQALAGLAVQIGGWIVQQAATWGAQLMAWGTAFYGWVAPMIPPALQALAGFAMQVGGWIVQQAPGWLQRLMAWGQAFVNWIAPMIPSALAALSGFASRAVTWIGEQAPILLQKGGFCLTPQKGKITPRPLRA